MRRASVLLLEPTAFAASRRTRVPAWHVPRFRSVAQPAKQRRQPPCGGCVMMIEQAGFSHHKGSDAGRGHGCAAARPLSKRGGGIADVRPRERGLQQTGHLESNGRNHDAVGRARTGRMNGNGQALRGTSCSSHPHDPYVKSRHSKAGHPDQFICRLQDIEDSGQAQIQTRHREQAHRRAWQFTILNMAFLPMAKKSVKN